VSPPEAAPVEAASALEEAVTRDGRGGMGAGATKWQQVTGRLLKTVFEFVADEEDRIVVQFPLAYEDHVVIQCLRRSRSII
jgi:hypothetical protein